jgi:hypothetical protein
MTQCKPLHLVNVIKVGTYPACMPGHCVTETAAQYRDQSECSADCGQLTRAGQSYNCT